MIPSVRFTKSDGNTGVVKPSSTGILAIIAASAIGIANQPGTFAREADVFAAKGLGPLIEYASYYMGNAGKPVLLITPTCTTAATYSAVDVTGVTGTSVVTAGASAPLDEYDVIVTIVHGGTIGVTGITYKYSLDGGVTTSPLQSLGTAVTMTLNAPVVNVTSGVGFALAAGTFIAGDVWKCTTTRAQMTNGDLITALEALRVSRLPWDAVLVDGDFSSSNLTTLDTWLTNLESKGVFKTGYMNTRMKHLPAPSGETEAAYATAMGTLTASSSSIRIDVGCDGGDLPSLITGLVQRRPVSLAVSTRKVSTPVGVDPAQKDLGPVPGFQISDTNGNPKWHDEANYPGLDDLRLTTFRSFEDDAGVFINNARLLSPSNSDYVYDQHAFCMNAACTLAFQGLKKELSKGVRKQDPDPITNAIYILEDDAAAIEATVNPPIEAALKGQVNATRFILSRTDDFSSNAGATATGDVEVEELEYIKNFAITAKFVKSITVST